MSRFRLLPLAAIALLPVAAAAQADQKIASAMSAAPASISAAATIMDWDNATLRAGTNGWTCFPDNPQSPGNDPMCLDAPWLNWIQAYAGKTAPTIQHMGIGYMITGDSPSSNTDPYAPGPTPDNEWMAEGVPHIMIVVPKAEWLAGLATDPKQGGPWVMWRGTPYAHIMVPLPKK